jgi:hypothetical protein
MRGLKHMTRNKSENEKRRRQSHKYGKSEGTEFIIQLPVA